MGLLPVALLTLVPVDRQLTMGCEVACSGSRSSTEIARLPVKTTSPAPRAPWQTLAGACLVSLAVPVSGHLSPATAAEAPPAAASAESAAADTTTRTTACQQGRGEIRAAIERKNRRVFVHFDLVNALPLQEYGFGVEFAWRKPGQPPQAPGSYDGATTTSLLGTADFAGFMAPRTSIVTYKLIAASRFGECRVKGVTRPR